MSNEDFYTRPRGYRHHNCCADHNPHKGRKHLRKALARLAFRRSTFAEKSAGGHVCHKPGSMKK